MHRCISHNLPQIEHSKDQRSTSVTSNCNHSLFFSKEHRLQCQSDSRGNGSWWKKAAASSALRRQKWMSQKGAKTKQKTKATLCHILCFGCTWCTFQIHFETIPSCQVGSTIASFLITSRIRSSDQSGWANYDQLQVTRVLSPDSAPSDNTIISKMSPCLHIGIIHTSDGEKYNL